jgi:tetratricopeptide (TPR) repeat protein
MGTVRSIAMSLRTCHVGVSVILGLAALSAVAVGAGRQDPPDASGSIERSGRGVATANRDQATAPRTVDDNARRQPTARAPSRKPGEKARPRRVEVRDLRDSRSDARRPDPRRDQYDWGYRYPRNSWSYGPYGGYYGYGWYVSPHWGADVYRAYRYAERKEHERVVNREEMAEREQRLLSQHERAVQAGLRRLKEGQPERATVAFTLAAKLNQGDPACRILLAQARLAQGHYQEAALALRRALELQPKLIYVDLGLSERYATADALDTYTDALAVWVRENAVRPEVWFLLGFLEFQRGDFEAAYTSFQHANEGLSGDELTRQYLGITKPAQK